jgi:hypothetical protein
MTNKSKAIGTSVESAVVKFLQFTGFPQAHRRTLSGSNDVGDVWLDSRGKVVIECKGGKVAESASDGQVSKWLLETERERTNSKADLGILVMKRAGIGVDRAAYWWAVMSWKSYCSLLGLRLCERDEKMGPVRMHLHTVVDLLNRYYGTDTYLAVDYTKQPEVDFTDLDSWPA